MYAGTEQAHLQREYDKTELLLDTLERNYPTPTDGGPNEVKENNKSFTGKDPSNVTVTTTYDPATNEYVVDKKAGDLELKSTRMSFEEYAAYDLDRSIKNYWKTRNNAVSRSSSSSLSDLIPALKITPDFDDLIFGKDDFSVKFNGSIEIILGFIRNRRDDPALDIEHRKTFNFNFDQKLQVNVSASIGDKLSFNLAHNTDALFDFENKLKLQYAGKEDDIIKELQLGDVSFPLNTSLIEGAQNLFGAKVKMQFGKTYVTTVFSEQRGETKHITVEGGAQQNQINFKADEYEENKHFFLAQYFRENYNKSLSMLPIINSNINITKIEVWVTTIGSPVTTNRNIIGFTDMGESNPLASNIAGIPGARPNNSANNLFSVVDMSQIRDINTAAQYLISNFGYSNGREFEKVESARKLTETEYTLNKALGFISLNSALTSDQVLAVSYQYQVIGDPTVYQVGEFSDAGIAEPQSLAVKLLRSSTLNTKSPLWRLMMKNVYSLNAYQVSSDGFRFNVLYAGDGLNIPTGFFKEGPKKGIPLVELFGMDQIDFQQNKNPDGVFDFIDNAATTGGLIESKNGRVYLPYTEPFGRDLYAIFGDSISAQPYVFKELYDLTKTEARQYPDKNKYSFSGVYKSSFSSDIFLGATNMPKGSVKVTAGTTQLVEDIDYTVDYMSGRVTIINQGILSSGVPINISTENNTMFNIMTKRLMGLRVDHQVNKNFGFGATIMNLHQSPLTEKVNLGEEPISNTIWGFDFNYDDESRWLTKMVDKILPFSTTTTPSRLSVYGEFAHFIPGHSKAIGKEGTSYIDDFEGSKSTFNLREPYSWSLASIPQWQNDIFPEGNSKLDKPHEGRETNYNRARTSWYTIDQLFYNRTGDRPSNISQSDISEPYVRDVNVTEVFPNKELPNGTSSSQPILNLAFYPNERGPYNYDVNGIPGLSSGIDQSGNLKDPSTRWGGIMRRIDNTDFEANNVEYIEFWIMDPFIGKDGQNGNSKNSGKLYFNLGDISEDLLRDSRKSFENGLPINATVTDVDTTAWGRVPSRQSIVRAFDSDPNAREFQDLGLDGLNDDDEVSFFREPYLNQILNTFGPASDAFLNAIDDPSADDYKYFRGYGHDNVPATDSNKILSRYKKFTNPQGNSPSSANNPESFPTQQTNYPNTEDINGDNTLNESENYFQYEITLDPDQMNVGENYITDIQHAYNVKLANGQYTDCKWYQFKVPIKSPSKVVGQIQNFQSIRFIRMFLKDFKEDVVLRFATLELVKNDWRNYTGNLLGSSAYINSSPADPTQVTISVVNIEENGRRQPIPYVLPPGIDRMVDYRDQNQRKENEQSLSVKITDLADGDARAIYKTTSMDIRQFKHLQMMVHAETVENDGSQKDGDLYLFVRLGADFSENFYEYAYPLKYTPWNTSDPTIVWPLENDMDIDLDALVGYKEQRNADVRSRNHPDNSVPYVVPLGNGRIATVVGSPTISDVKTIMIGVRNPKKINLVDGDDARPKSTEIWINELRLTEFNKESGVAGLIRTSATLGDLGNINVSGAYTSAYFGQLEQKISELSTDNVVAYDVSTNLELGKFLPKESGVKVPMHYDISQVISNPEYNPLDPDIKTKDDLKSYTNAESKEEVKDIIQDVTTRQNVNFMNVRKERTGEAKPQFYDIENFNVSYSYSSVKMHNYNVVYDNKINHKGGLGYNYSLAPKNVQPFANTAISKNKLWALISDFNFYYLPKSFSFTTDINREFNENQLRNNSYGDIIIKPTYYKRFDWNRNYALKFDLAKSLTLDYSARASSEIQEPRGKINTREKKDSVWQSVFSLGNIRHYNQTFSLAYVIPIDKLPYLDWVRANTSYSGAYRWEGIAPSLASLGNTIENSNAVTLKGDLDFVKLYNKSPYLRRINQGRRTTSARNQQQQADKNFGDEVARIGLRLLMGFRNAGASYGINKGMLLPGFLPKPQILGNNFNDDAPGLAFAFGFQDDIREKAARNGWLSKDTLQNTAFVTKFSEIFSARTLFEPIPDLKLEMNVSYNRVENTSSYFKYSSLSDRFEIFSPSLSGSYSVSTFMLKTLFKKDEEDHSNVVFDQFLENRSQSAEKLAKGNSNSVGYIFDSITQKYFPDGYGPTSQEVLIPAFIAAYSGKDISDIRMNAFKQTPLPNWTLTYNGLSKIPALRKIFNRITLQNAYKASYNVSSFTSNLLYEENNQGAWARDAANNFQSQYQISVLTVDERLSPLIKVDMEFINSLQLNFEMKKARTLNLSFVNNQLTENQMFEWVVGTGYRFKDVSFKAAVGGSTRTFKSDINLKIDLSVRSNKTMLRRIDQNYSLPSAGSKITTLNMSADYDLSKNLKIKLFFDTVINSPYIPNMYYNSTTSGGLSIMYRFG